GEVVGGLVFGYENVKIYPPGADPFTARYTHVERRIIPAQAAIVRRVFEMYDSGYGLKQIARILTAEKVPGPKGARRTDGLEHWIGWNPSTVNAMLKREDYRCVRVW